MMEVSATRVVFLDYNPQERKVACMVSSSCVSEGFTLELKVDMGSLLRVERRDLLLVRKTGERVGIF